jgi:hypothetical protein
MVRLRDDEITTHPAEGRAGGVAVNGGAVCGLLALAVSTIDSVPYVRDIFRGRTRPYRATWAIWTTLGIVVFIAQAADGASWSLLMVGAQAVAVTVVFGLSITRGSGGLGPVDLAIIAVAAAGIGGWYASSRPLFATACVVLADLAAVALMLPKTWRDPGSETPSSFLLAGVAGLLGTAAVGAIDPSLLLYPGYFAVVNTGLAGIIVVRQRSQRPRAAMIADQLDRGRNDASISRINGKLAFQSASGVDQ